jgi:exodeoxyribonuclease VII large subunit
LETLPLSTLAHFIRRVFALNLPEAVWVSAELAQVSESRGHTWLTLVEKDADRDEIVAQLDAVLWAGRLKRLRKEHSAKLLRGVLQEGMSVRLQVTTSFHERYGLKLVVENIDPDHTIGSLERRRQQTLTALSIDGILDRNARLPIPLLPQRLAVISSDTAAGLADFNRQLTENRFGYRFQTELYTAAMQGLQTVEEIMQRLRRITRRSDEYDCIVIVRGGGGKTDLAAFDDELLCRAVADAPLPVLAGIGHEIDDTVLDRVVHRSLKTPTAVAAYLVEQLQYAEGQILNLGRDIATTGTQAVHQKSAELSRYRSVAYQSATALLRSAHLRSAALEKDVFAAARRSVTAAKLQLENQHKLLTALRPETTLARGYALLSQEGRLVTSPDELKPGKVEVRLREGRTTLEKR